jgi:flagellar motor switch protein FliN/FliY
MPETAEAPTQNEQQQAPNGEKTQAQSVEFPQAPQGQASASGGQLDILLDMDVTVTVALGTTQIPVRRLLQLGPGAVLQIEKSIEAPVDLYLKDSKFAEAEVVVVDNRFAVRVKTITGAGVGAATTES